MAGFRPSAVPRMVEIAGTALPTGVRGIRSGNELDGLD
jgi:hypothetical protein